MAFAGVSHRVIIYSMRWVIKLPPPAAADNLNNTELVVYNQIFILNREQTYSVSHPPKYYTENSNLTFNKDTFN